MLCEGIRACHHHTQDNQIVNEKNSGKEGKGKKDERNDKSGPSLHNYHAFRTFGGRTSREIFFGVQKI